MQQFCLTIKYTARSPRNVVIETKANKWSYNNSIIMMLGLKIVLKKENIFA